MAKKSALGSSAIVSPNFGLYLDRPAISLAPRMLKDGYNFRIKNGSLNNLNLGWARFDDFQLNGPVLLIDNFFIRGQNEKLIFATTTDLYVYDDNGSVAFITPRYAVGTAAVSGTAVTGTATVWTTNAKAGDQITFGVNDGTDPDLVWYTIDTVTDDLNIILSETGGTIADGPYTIRQTFTGDVDDIWVTDTFVNASPSNEDEWWATNGTDDIVRWNGSDDQVEVMSALAFTAKSLSVYQNMMIFGALTQGGEFKPTDIINSNPGEPQNVTTGLSEQFKVHSGVDHIQTMSPIGDSLGIYSEATVSVAQFVGGDLIFVFRNAVNGTGALSPRAVADFGTYHEFLGRDSQYVFDGVTVREINQHVWREWLRTQDPVRTNFVFNIFDEENAELLWVVPSTVDPGAGSAGTAPSRASVEHYLEDTGLKDGKIPYSLRAFPFTAAGYYTRQSGLTWEDLTDTWEEYNFRWNDQFFFATFPLILVGDADGKIYTLNEAQNGDGVALPSFVKFGRRAVGDGRMRGLLARVYPFASSFSTPLDVTVHMVDHAMGSPTINATFSFDQTLPEGGHFVSTFRRGRFAELEFGTAGPSMPWELSGYDLDIKAGGRR